jgi:hypothetical protein
VTIEIRQMVIKSSMERGQADSGREVALADEECEDGCGNSEGNFGGSEERRRLRVLFMRESERMRER